MIKNYLFILLLCLAGRLQAQTTLEGEIVDNGNQPLPGVQVNFNHGLRQTVSDNTGKFTITYPDTLKSGSIRF
ncbi:MAG: carboxypeptidase-like regulatory domain-containing protein, partial [Prevotellaceae bacterium]|nr:carboxypeptidase-like regulatory domain-containing protein [Prevotellaceae bacterium]